MAELVATYRLPENLFDDAKVTVDVVIFQRTNTPQKDWIDSQGVAFANGNHLHMTNYFVDHPNHVIGKLGTYEAYSFFEDKPRQGLKCIAPLEEVKKRTSELIQTLRPLVE